MVSIHAKIGFVSVVCLNLMKNANKTRITTKRDITTRPTNNNMDFESNTAGACVPKHNLTCKFSQTQTHNKRCSGLYSV